MTDRLGCGFGEREDETVALLGVRESRGGDGVPETGA